jgi:hypothetical protein
MGRLILILTLAVLRLPPCWAQLYPPNEGGCVPGRLAHDCAQCGRYHKVVGDLGR